MTKGKKRKRKRAGHYCWDCDSHRANEKFSGSGHVRHLCRDCAKLGAEELGYRQALRNLERCVTWEGFIRHKQRKIFERYLRHDNARIRALALRIEQEDAVARAHVRASRDLEEALLESDFSD